MLAIGSGREGLFAYFPDTRIRKGLPGASLDYFAFMGN